MTLSGQRFYLGRNDLLTSNHDRGLINRLGNLRARRETNDHRVGYDLEVEGEGKLRGRWRRGGRVMRWKLGRDWSGVERSLCEL